MSLATWPQRSNSFSGGFEIELQHVNVDVGPVTGANISNLGPSGITLPWGTSCTPTKLHLSFCIKSSPDYQR